MCQALSTVPAPVKYELFFSKHTHPLNIYGAPTLWQALFSVLTDLGIKTYMALHEIKSQSDGEDRRNKHRLNKSKITTMMASMKEGTWCLGSTETELC